MADLLVRLYDLPDYSDARVSAAGVLVRRALSPERQVVMDWIGPRFAPAWVSEAAVGLGQQPPTVFLAIREGVLLGFACYDSTARGFFGPIGVDEAARGGGIGEALLMATLWGMRGAGYSYAVIGAPGPVEFYTRRLDAIEIPKSKPGIYAGVLQPQ